MKPISVVFDGKINNNISQKILKLYKKKNVFIRIVNKIKKIIKNAKI